MKSFLFLQNLGAGDVIIIALVFIFVFIIRCLVNAGKSGRPLR